MAETSIEWTDRVWNPVTGCSKVSQGCKHCYANSVADRFFAKQYPPNADGTPRQFTDVRTHDDRLDVPLHWKKPSKVFVNSMSDLFHEDVEWTFLDRVWAVFSRCPQHTFQVLTKRPQRMFLYMKYRRDEGAPELPNVWLGVSVENQATADERIPLLLRTPAVVRWISAEPLLGPIALDDITVPQPVGEWHFSCLGDDGNVEDDPDFHGASLDWVVVGGESGPNARPMHPAWAQSLRDQCTGANVPFFFKQWGEWQPFSTTEGVQIPVFGNYNTQPDVHGGRTYYSNFLKAGKHVAGRLLDGRTWDEYPKAVSA